MLRNKMLLAVSFAIFAAYVGTGLVVPVWLRLLVRISEARGLVAGPHGDKAPGTVSKSPV